MGTARTAASHDLDFDFQSLRLGQEQATLASSTTTASASAFSFQSTPPTSLSHEDLIDFQEDLRQHPVKA